MVDDFKDHPVSLTEARAGKVREANVWTPRDALIDLLRRIDGGEKLDALIVVYRATQEDGGVRIGYNLATPDAEVGQGLLSRAAYLINEG